jgi:hypothetical protein
VHDEPTFPVPRIRIGPGLGIGLTRCDVMTRVIPKAGPLLTIYDIKVCCSL